MICQKPNQIVVGYLFIEKFEIIGYGKIQLNLNGG